MMTLNEQILGEARKARDELLEHQHEIDRAQADFQHAVRRLHAAGGSMREIGESLGLSHQRVHQIVDTATPGAAGEDAGDLVARLRRGVGGLFGSFAADAREIVAGAQEESSSLGHDFIGTEHLLLSLLRAGGPGTGALGTTYEEARERVVAEVGEEPKRRRRRRGGGSRFTPAAKRTLERALRTAHRLGDDHIGSEHILLGLLQAGGGAATVLGDTDAIQAAVLRDLGRE